MGRRVPLVVSVEEGLREKLVEAALRENRSVSNFVETVLKEVLKSAEKS